MDARLFRPYAHQQEHEFRVRGLEFKLLDGSREAPADAREEARTTAIASRPGTATSASPASPRCGA